MPRKQVELSSEYPYHIYARSNNRDWFDVSLKSLYGIYANVMKKTIEEYKIEAHAFVLMANHFHMLISTPQSNLSSAMRYFMTETSRAIARTSGRINRIYGARYRWTIIRNSEHYAHALYYVYRNPIHHGAVSSLVDYPWSTFHIYHRKFSSLIRPKRNGYEEFIPKTKAELNQWLHKDPGDRYQNSLRQALHHHEFKFPRCTKSSRRFTFIDKLHYKITPGTGAGTGAGTGTRQHLL